MQRPKSERGYRLKRVGTNAEILYSEELYSDSLTTVNRHADNCLLRHRDYCLLKHTQIQVSNFFYSFDLPFELIIQEQKSDFFVGDYMYRV